MTDTPVQVESNSAEKVALDLLHVIAHVERKALHSGAAEGWTSADRAWILRTYGECIQAVRGAPPTTASKTTAKT